MKMLYCILVLMIIPLTVALTQEKVDEGSLLMQLDRDFDKATAEKGVNGWVAYFAPNGSMLGDTSKPTTGLAEIRAQMDPVFKDSTLTLRWHPTKAK